MVERVIGWSLPLEGIEAVGFDAFGTLIDYPLRPHPYRRLFEQERMNDTDGGDQSLRRRILTSPQTLEQLAVGCGLESQLPTMQDELARELAAVRLYPDVVDSIRKLRAAGYRIGVCSNLAQAYGDIVRKLLGDYVDALVLSFEVGLVKPEQEIFAHLSDRLGVAAGATIFIGDSVASDVHGATRAGLTGRQIRRESGQTLRDVLGYVAGRGRP